MTSQLVAGLWEAEVTEGRRWGGPLGILVLLVGCLCPQVSRAQEAPGDTLRLIDRYRTARHQMLVQQVLEDRPVPGLPPLSFPTALDSLVETGARGEPAAPASTPTVPVDEVRRVQHLERSWFQSEYGDTSWSFLGPGTRLTVFDTTRTRELRARLEAQFGPPTRTPAEMDLRAWAQKPDSSREAPVQFAYWFIVNDSIPVRVTAVGGPDERGLIVSTDRSYRNDLRALREGVLGPLRDGERAPYVDYYYDDARRHWYRVGFDGTAFFRTRISRRDIVSGQRPRLKSDRASRASPGAADSTASP